MTGYWGDACKRTIIIFIFILCGGCKTNCAFLFNKFITFFSINVLSYVLLFKPDI